MTVEVNFSLLGFERLLDKITGADEEINRTVSNTLNANGPSMVSDAVTAVSSSTGLPPEVVRTAVTSASASTVDPTFRITAGGDNSIYFRWITRADEKVCGVCGPRHGRLYSQADIERIGFPAHINCRCELEETSIPGALLAEAGELYERWVPNIVQGVISSFMNYWGRR